MLNMFFNFSEPSGWLITGLFGIGLFFILREAVTWYWKINRSIELLEKIEENTRPKETDKKSITTE